MQSSMNMNVAIKIYAYTAGSTLRREIVQPASARAECEVISIKSKSLIEITILKSIFMKYLAGRKVADLRFPMHTPV